MRRMRMDLCEHPTPIHTQFFTDTAIELKSNLCRREKGQTIFLSLPRRLEREREKEKGRF
jgi:hypothetical protein